MRQKEEEVQRPCGWRAIDVLTAEQGGQCGWKRVSKRKVLVDVRTRSQITWQLLGHHKDFAFYCKMGSHSRTERRD